MKPGSVDLITGIGYALRVVHVRTAPVTLIAGEGAAMALTELQPGDVVRADCHMTEQGLVADKIELKRRAP